jgi:hypothetical protein
MATRRYKISVGENEHQIVEEAGAAVNSDAVELTVELATTTVNVPGGTRAITRDEVLLSLEKIRNHIVSKPWPPA